MKLPLQRGGRGIFWMTLFVWFAAAPAVAEVKRAKIEIYGMTCSACVFGCEKQLKKVAGVDTVRIDLKQANATLTSKEGHSLNVRDVHSAVRKSGYTPGPVEIDVIGRIKSEAPDRLFLISRGDETTYALHAAEITEKEALSGLADSVSVIQVTGIVEDASADPVRMRFLEVVDVAGR